MTTAQSRRPTGQPSFSMIVAGQPSTVIGQIRDDETLYFTHGRQGNHPADPGRVTDFLEYSFREPRNPRMVYGLLVTKGEHEPLSTRFSVDELEHSWYRASLGGVQAAELEDNPWVVGENFGRSHTDQMSWMGEHYFDDRVYQWRPSLSGELTSFEDSRRAFIEANRHPLSPRGREWLVNYDFALPADPPRFQLGLGLIEAFHAVPDVYDKRIEDLRELAADEEIAVNETSVRDFRYFVGSVVPSKNAQLVVMDNGNLRAVWRDDYGSHLGLQFLGGRLVQYVVFRKGGPEGKVYRIAGNCSFDEMRKSIWNWELSSLVSA